MKEVIMLDTIVLTIPKGQYHIFEPDKFQPLLTRGAYVQNPTKEDKLNGIYKPRLTIIPRGLDLPLRVEFSAPKLIYGNNIDEIEETDFDKVAETLKDRLTEMGVKILRFNIDNAPVSTIHYSKNFPLSDYIPASLIIKELGKINLNGKLDLNNTHFRNDGHAIYYYSSSYHIIFYDKLTDIKTPVKRAVDKDKTFQQLSLFDTFKEEKMKNEILRFEFRLTNRQKLKSVINDKTPTFQTIFNQSLAQKVLLSYWSKVIDENMQIFQLSALDPINILQTIIKNPKVKVKDALATLGVKFFVDKQGIKTLKDMIKHRFTIESWYRFNKVLEDTANQPFPVNFVTEELKGMKQKLIEFKPFKFADLGKT